MVDIARQTGKEGKADLRRRNSCKHTEVSNHLIYLGNFKQFSVTGVAYSRSDITRINVWRRKPGLLYMKQFGLLFHKRLNQETQSYKFAHVFQEGKENQN